MTWTSVLQTAVSAKFLFIYYWVASAVYVHYRGKDRYDKFLRQLTDHSTFFAPINVFLYIFSKVERKPYIPVKRFPELKLLDKNWETIRDEGLRLIEENKIIASDQCNDAGFNSFFRRGWTRFYLTWYGNEQPSAQQFCPKTLALLKQVPGMKAAMFARLPAGGDLMRHRDPYAGSLRYHLGLSTPNDDQCAIVVDNEPYSWRDGKSVLFDETFLHYAYNKTDKDRLILFCDIERPMNNFIARWLNRLFSRVIMGASVSPNDATDRTGWVNRLFRYVYQVRKLGKQLKTKSRFWYYLLKYVIIFGLLYLIFFVIF